MFFDIIVFSFDLDMDCIIRYRQCFPFWFTTPSLIPSYSICSLCRGSTCFAHPFSSVDCQSIWHNSLACIFTLPFLVFVISMEKKATKMLMLVCVHTWQRTCKNYKRSIQLEHMHWLPKDLQRWHHILLHLHRHNYITHEHLLMWRNMLKQCVHWPLKLMWPH